MIIYAAGSEDDAEWVVNSCKYVIVEGHHRFAAVTRINENKSAGIFIPVVSTKTLMEHILCPNFIFFLKFLLLKL